MPNGFLDLSVQSQLSSGIKPKYGTRQCYMQIMTRRLPYIIGAMIVVFCFDDCHAITKMLRRPIKFSYGGDLETSAATEHDEGRKRHEAGGGTKHEVDHRQLIGKKGDKGYGAHREFDKGEKGHHDVVGHELDYDESVGHEKKEHYEDGHYGVHHEGEKGEKEASFEEDAKHQKGHSTKGEHNIFKKDEYEKKHDFYDEFHEGGDEEEEGGYHQDHEDHKGGHLKESHHDSRHHQDRHGEEKEHDEGHHNADNKGHKLVDGHKFHQLHREDGGKKGGVQAGKKWSLKRGNR